MDGNMYLDDTTLDNVLRTVLNEAEAKGVQYYYYDGLNYTDPETKKIYVVKSNSANARIRTEAFTNQNIFNNITESSDIFRYKYGGSVYKLDDGQMMNTWSKKGHRETALRRMTKKGIERVFKLKEYQIRQLNEIIRCEFSDADIVGFRKNWESKPTRRQVSDGELCYIVVCSRVRDYIFESFRHQVFRDLFKYRCSLKKPKKTNTTKARTVMFNDAHTHRSNERKHTFRIRTPYPSPDNLVYPNSSKGCKK